ncbi:MAG: hypothetical protein H6Q84_1102 [Deltaproteobacteria bacterium]|nr:hypothetical protein [Deltaproteobacteria bacterium]
MRLPVLDTFSAICLFLVVCVHTNPQIGGDWQIMGAPGATFLLSQGCRFVLPFFFITAGYYYGKALQMGVEPFAFLVLFGRKLLYIFFSWSVIYAIIPPFFIHEWEQFGLVDTVYYSLSDTYDWLISNRWKALIYGTKPHLWFITSSLIGITVASVFCRRHLKRYLIPFGIVLYVVGLLGGSYAITPIGLPQYQYFDLQAPFVSTLFIAIGRMLSVHHKRNMKLALTLFFGGALVHFAEVYCLYKAYGMDVLNHHFLLGTTVWGAGAFLLCLEFPNAGRDSFLESIGKLTMGIYVSHVAIIYIVTYLDRIVPGLPWEIAKPFAVLVLSYCLSLGLSRVRILAKFLT